MDLTKCALILMWLITFSPQVKDEYMEQQHSRHPAQVQRLTSGRQQTRTTWAAGARGSINQLLFLRCHLLALAMHISVDFHSFIACYDYS
ncbi:hypothetical protein DFJ58DRAFT_766586 [Suillus subalutaceus]|uniref:uncharacterized protein n=1 Tax=Suillus subalutaceus TaxID=48586 RepID=UPI001B864AE3|nr:uncharacterized protein DFJ58DRAFT_766586 [Suillus subalutaceus]KAG1869006.1 hypothetical protein DFJ58DRAFT_766586 [Suillus subalutaceus]